MDHYKATLSQISTFDSLSNHIKKLGEIKTETEDEELKRKVKNVITMLQKEYKDTKTKSLPISLEDKSGHAIHSLIDYCNQFIDDTKPEWQVVAEQHGWTPPTE